MKTVGLIADTHCFLPDIVKTFLADTDEIWHLGDIFSQACFDAINDFKEITHAVRGNWDNTEDIPLSETFFFSRNKIFMIHKGILMKDGIRQFYNGVWNQVREDNVFPHIILCGHTHHFDYARMVDMMTCANRSILCLNPGAVTPLFHERGSCLKLFFEGSVLKEVVRLSYDCPTMKLKFFGGDQYGKQCLMPSIYKEENELSKPYFEIIDMIESRPLNVKVESVKPEDWRDGSHWKFSSDIKNPWKHTVELGSGPK